MCNLLDRLSKDYDEKVGLDKTLGLVPQIGFFIPDNCFPNYANNL